MALPALYLEGLMQRSLCGTAELDAYKLGLIEAVLKDVVRTGAAGDAGEEVESAVRTAIEVARWEPSPPPRGSPDG